MIVKQCPWTPNAKRFVATEIENLFDGLVANGEGIDNV
jgi:hypothetical protein